MSSPTIRVYDPITYRTPALNLLRSQLPHSLSTYRRLQFGQWSPSARLLSNVSLDSNSPVPSILDSQEAPHPWILAFIDRDQRPETEVWLACSWESSDSSSGESKIETDEARAVQDALVRDLVVAMRDLSLTLMPNTMDAAAAAANGGPAAAARDHVGLSIADYAGHMANPNIVLFGSVHEATTMILQRIGLLADEFATTLVPNHNYIFSIADLPAARDLPSGLRWGVPAQTEHFELIRSRTQIPRQDRTLKILPALAIFLDGSQTPISWAFVGLDGSLTTLHVEPEYRGKGLAKIITAKLFRENMQAFEEERGEVELAQSIVIKGNEASSRVAESLGGQNQCEVYWLRVDLGRLQ